MTALLSDIYYGISVTVTINWNNTGKDCWRIHHLPSSHKDLHHLLDSPTVTFDRTRIPLPDTNYGSKVHFFGACFLYFYASVKLLKTNMNATFLLRLNSLRISNQKSLQLNCSTDFFLSKFYQCIKTTKQLQSKAGHPQMCLFSYACLSFLLLRPWPNDLEIWIKWGILKSKNKV